MNSHYVEVGVKGVLISTGDYSLNNSTTVLLI